MRASRLFYGVLVVLLAGVCFHVGSSAVSAQGAPTLVALLPTGGAVHGAALDNSGRLFYRGTDGVWLLAPTQMPPGTPVDVMLAFDPLQSRTVHWIAMANGDVYTFPEGTDLSQPFAFTYLGNVFSPTVSVQNQSWDKVKGSYRR